MAPMSNLVINDSKFPVGTQVSVYPAASANPGGGPIGAPGSGAVPVETQTVDSAGLATFTTLVDGVDYVLYAADQYIRIIKSSVFNAALFPTWKARVAARRAAIGTS